MAKPEEKALASVEPNALAMFDESEIGAGFENTTSDDFKVPFVSLLQTLSPQCNPAKAQYMADARPGLFLDPATGDLLKEFEVIPCFYQRKMVEWRPQAAGGGFVAQHDPGVEIGLPKDEKGIPITKDGNMLKDTRYYFCLRLHPDGDTSMVILALSSTQIKKSKAWLTALQAPVMGPGGRKVMPPLYRAIWKVSSVAEQKGDFSWFGYKFDFVKNIDTKDVADKARAAKLTFQTVQVKPPVDVDAEPTHDPNAPM